MEIVLAFIQTNAKILIYGLIVILASIGLAILLAKQLGALTQVRKQRVKRKDFFNAVHTTGPHGRPAGNEKKKRLANIDNQFSISKKLIIPAGILVLLFGALLPVMNQLPGTIVSLFLGVVTVIVGIAAKPFVENIIAGLVISYSKVLNIGDTVLLDGKYGNIEDIGLAYTTIKIWDWRRYVVPNTNMLQNEFINYHLGEKYQWAYIEFYLSYETDIEHIAEHAVESTTKSQYMLTNEQPKFWVMGMEKDSVMCWLAAWAGNATDAWYLKNDMRRSLIKVFKEHDVKVHKLNQNIDGFPNQ